MKDLNQGDSKQLLLDAAARMGLVTTDIELAKTYINNYTNMTHTTESFYGNWERMGVTSALGGKPGGGSPTGNVWGNAQFDGRYMYFSPYSSSTFCRYDTTMRFTDTSAWSKISVLEVYQNDASFVTGGEYWDVAFDGRYIYYAPQTSYYFVRYDTTSSFTNSSAWERCKTYTAHDGTNTSLAYGGAAFDGKYVYYAPYNSHSFVRYNTHSAFGSITSWHRLSIEQVGGTYTTGMYADIISDGHYLYFVPVYSRTFVRYDISEDHMIATGDITGHGTPYWDGSAWETLSTTTIHQTYLNASFTATDQMYYGGTFDGRYIYFSPRNSASFLRYDTTRSFTSSSAWVACSMSTAQGSAAVTNAFMDAKFDGRYIYFTPMTYSGKFVRYDTTMSFTSSSSWSRMSMSTLTGGDTNAIHYSAGFDGKYMYFNPGVSDSFLRVRATWSNKPD